MNYTWEITDVRQPLPRGRWFITIDDCLTYSSKNKPPYKIGDKILSLQHCINYMQAH